MVSLKSSPVGKIQEVKWVGGSKSEVENLSKAGIAEGALITVINKFHGGVIIAINNLRYALGNDVADCIKVGEIVFCK